MNQEPLQQVEPLWETLVPSFGSALLFVAAMITLIVTIKSTNKRALADRDAAQKRANDDRDAAQKRANEDRNAAQQRANADRDAALARARDDRSEARRREADTWRRDTLLRLGAEAMEAAYAIEDTYRAIASEPNPEKLPSHLDEIEKQANRIGASFFTLRLIGAHDAADQCREIRKAFASRDLRTVSLECHRVYRRLAVEDASTNPNDSVTHLTFIDKLDRALQPSVHARSRLGDTVEDELRALNPSDGHTSKSAVPPK